jgi:hypothetical protein
MTTEALCELLSKENLVSGYVYTYEGFQSEYLFEHSPSNIASFIMQHPDAREIILTDVLDRKILNTIGYFIDRCLDQKLLPQIMEHLLPMQLGDKEPQEFPVATTEEVEALYEMREQFGMNME